MALEITDENLEEILSSSKIVVLDFWAAWCGPCRMVGPIIEELASENEDNGDIAIGKVNVDENPQAAAKFGIRSIPTILFFKDGEQAMDGDVPVKLVGANPKSAIQDKIDGLM